MRSPSTSPPLHFQGRFFLHLAVLAAANPAAGCDQGGVEKERKTSPASSSNRSKAQKTPPPHNHALVPPTPPSSSLSQLKAPVVLSRGGEANLCGRGNCRPPLSLYPIRVEKKRWNSVGKLFYDCAVLLVIGEITASFDFFG